MILDNQPVIFNIRYTPYQLAKNASETEIAKHAEERAFYDMSGKNNILSYMSQEKKTNYDSILDYLEKTSKVFNQNGMISVDELTKMKERIQKNKGNIWHGFISLNEEHSHQIDSIEKSIQFVKEVFSTFFKSAKFHTKNMDLMCALHNDRPHHLHIHFVFWEKEPLYKGKDGTLIYRRKGKIDKSALDMMFVKSGIFVNEKQNDLYPTRDEALKELKTITAFKTLKVSPKEIKKEMIKLSKDLPKTGRLSYGSKDMEGYQKRIDKIVAMLLENDEKAKLADKEFYDAFEERKKLIQNIIGKTYGYMEENKVNKLLPKYHFHIDEKNIHIIEDIEKDYKRRQGNIILQVARNIQPELINQNKKRKASDTNYKKSLHISEKKITSIFNQFLSSFPKESMLLKRDFCNRLKEIEEEMKKEREEKEYIQK